MTSIVSPATPKIVGKALYLELVADPTLSATEQRDLIGWQFGGTKQIILFPEYQDDTGRVHPAKALSRIVSTHTPRSQWDTQYFRNPKPIDPTLDPSSNYLMLETYTKEEWDSMPLVKKAESKKLAIEMYLRSEMFDEMYVGEGDERKVVAKQSWVVRDNKTFSVEVTDEDYDDLIHKSKTPQAVIRRINKVRDSISTFPKKLG
jgi:hypothetical protein